MTKLRRPLQLHVIATILAGAVAIAWALWAVEISSPRPLVIFALLAIGAGLAQRWPVAVSPKMKLTVEDTATFAGALILGAPLAILLGAVSTLVGLRLNARMSWYNRAFNVALVSLGQAAAALTYATFASSHADLVHEPIALVAAAAAKYLLEMALLDLAVALQMRRRPFAGWWSIHRRDLPYLSALYALGVLAAIAVTTNPIAFVLFVIPVVVVFWAMRDTMRMRERTTAAVYRLADLVDQRDPFTHGHSVRVAQLAERLALRLRMQPAQVDLCRTAARVHDIGKVATDQSLLLKPGALDDTEQGVMQRHADHGAELLRELPDFWEGAEIVRMHHERVDGRGYPNRRSGTELPLEVAVVAVADAYDAMASDRPYRRALSWEEARAELLRGRGTQWDARVVDVFIAMVQDERGEASRAALHPALA